MKTLLLLVEKTWYEFGEDNASQMAAAITYYVLFALVPLTIVILSSATIPAPRPPGMTITWWPSTSGDSLISHPRLRPLKSLRMLRRQTTPLAAHSSIFSRASSRPSAALT